MVVQEEYRDSELGYLPSDWPIEKLGNLAKTYSGGTPNRSIPAYWNGEIPWAKSGELNDRRIYEVEEKISEAGLKNSSAKFVEENDLLVALYGATAGKVGLAKSKFTINQAICAIKPNEKLLSDFYFYYFIFIREKLLSQRYGGAQPNISQQTIRNLIIPVPNIHEQKQIAIILAKIQNAKEKSEHILRALRELKKSLMKHLFTYGAVSLEDVTKVKLKETQIGEVPEDWKIEELRNLCILITDGKHGDCQNEKGSGYYFLSAKDIVDEKAIYDNAREITKDDFLEAKKRTRHELGDILVTNSGTIGKVAVPKDNDKIERTTFQKSVAIIKPKIDLIEPDFLGYFLTFSNIRLTQISRGVAQKNLLLHDLRAFKVALPKKSSQLEIISTLLPVDKRIDSEKNTAKALDGLFKTALANLMSAKVRVNNLEF